MAKRKTGKVPRRIARRGAAPRKSAAKKSRGQKPAAQKPAAQKPTAKTRTAKHPAIVPPTSAIRGPRARKAHGLSRRKKLQRAVLPRLASAQGKRRLGKSLFDTGLDRVPANFQPLTPLSFLARAAHVHPEATAIVHGSLRRSYGEFYARSRRLASALHQRGIGKNETVAALLPNTPAMLEAHHGVPMAGAVLNAINTRLDAASIAFMLDHGEARAFLVDAEFASLAEEALARARVRPSLILCRDDQGPAGGPLSGAADYEEFLDGGDPDFAWDMPADEWDAIALNYTSGTTGNPKGVVYHHRGAALMGYSNILAGEMSVRPVYLWTLPMFHCNGWCFPWTLSLVAGTHVCLRQVRAKDIYDLIVREKVTHLCGAPIVMATLLNAKDDEKRSLPRRVRFLTAAAPPPETVLAGMSEAGFDVIHVYGLTEVYGPAVVNDWKPAWDTLPADERARLKARQGVAYHALEGLAVLDPETMQPVAGDGATLGEVMMRGNIVMKGYLKNEEATREAFEGGWFHTGDLGVIHPDNYIQLKDRSKDIIISGGENISSIEVEDALYKHPAVLFVAVVARPDAKWGEHPCAFVELKPGHEALGASELIRFCADRLARYKLPKTVVFGPLPKTSTGKIQKFQLRARAKMLDDGAS